jgi:hypothetical protein
LANPNPNVTPIGLPSLVGLTAGQRAIRAARLYQTPTGFRIDLEEAAELFRVSSSTISTAKYLIKHGTPEEIALVEDGKKALVAFTRAIRARNKSKTETVKKIVLPPPKRSRNTNTEQRLRAQIWFQLKRGLNELASMPAARDMAILARQMDRSNFIASKLLTVINWLGEFEDEWTGP